MAAIRDEKTLMERPPALDLHPNRIREWPDQSFGGAIERSLEAPTAEPETVINVNILHAMIGELPMQNEWSCTRRDERH